MRVALEAPPPADPHRSRDRARPRRDHRRDLQERRRDRAGLPRAAEERRAAAALDGRRRHDGSLLRSDEPAADRAPRRARASRLPSRTTSTTASTITSIHERAPDARRRGPDGRPAAPPRRALEARRSSATPPCIPPSSSKRHGGIDPRNTSPTPGITVAAAARGPLRARGLDQSRRAEARGTTRYTTRLRAAVSSRCSI